MCTENTYQFEYIMYVPMSPSNLIVKYLQCILICHIYKKYQSYCTQNVKAMLTSNYLATTKPFSWLCLQKKQSAINAHGCKPTNHQFVTPHFQCLLFVPYQNMIIMETGYYDILTNKLW